VSYATGSELEKAIFDEESSGLALVREFWDVPASFGPDITTLLEKSKTVCPDTRLGWSLYRHVLRELRREYIDSRGLIFLSTINTKADARHQTDGLFYLPSLHPYLVTVDVFNKKESEIKKLRAKWEDSFEGNLYSNTNFQSDLYRFKKGVSEFKKELKKIKRILSREEEESLQIDFRQYAKSFRPENHFILTPQDIRSYGSRRSFAKLVVGYFLKVAGQKKA
jgi:uncharacterized protein YaaR (DUF327 family)